MLTRKQYELLLYLEQRLSEDGISPSFDEMREALGLRSKSGIHRLITGLVERGFIKRLPHRARAIEIIKLPDNKKSSKLTNDVKLDLPSDSEVLPNSNVINGNFNFKSNAIRRDSEAMDLPLYGRIAAGTPIEALRDQTNSINVPSSLLGAGEYYALEVDGDSMRDAGIEDGDTVIIEYCDSAENGTIVVALVDNSEVTLKRIRKKGNSVALEPANESYETRICGPDQVMVQGRLVGLIRAY